MLTHFPCTPLVAMAAYAEIVNSKGAFRASTLRVVSNAKPSFASQCFKPETFPKPDPGDVVHTVVCGGVVKNPKGGTIYCENGYPCLEYITCPYKGEPVLCGKCLDGNDTATLACLADYSTTGSYHPPVNNPRHDQVQYLQWFSDHLGRKCLSFLPPKKRLAPAGHRTFLRMGKDGPWCVFEKGSAAIRMNPV